ncbi:aldose epimerase family protein [Oxalobacteraceae bacterium A2-2]
MMADDVSAGYPLSSGRLHTLRNARGMRLTISEQGAALVSWWAPDRYGRMADVLLGYAGGGQVASQGGTRGAAVGAWASRIAQGRYTLDGATLQVGADGGPTLGGAGLRGARWQAAADQDGLVLRLETAHGDSGADGLPGRLQVQVRYRLDDDGSLTVACEAVADVATTIHLSVHPYFNLNGGSADVGDHMLQIAADHYLRIDAGGLPVGRAPVSGTPFDFREPAAIGARLGWPDPQLRLAGGFDHCYCVDLPQEEGGGGGACTVPREVARVVDPGSGRRLQVSTTGAGLQFYSGNVLEGVQGRAARPYVRHDGFCLEAQAGAGPAGVLLQPGRVHRQVTVYRLSLQA